MQGPVEAGVALPAEIIETKAPEATIFPLRIPTKTSNPISTLKGTEATEVADKGTFVTMPKQVSPPSGRPPVGGRLRLF